MNDRKPAKGSSAAPGTGELEAAGSTRPSEQESDDTVGLYMQEVGGIPLLTKKQEVELAKRIERGRRARRSLAKAQDGGSIASMAPEQIEQLKGEVEDGWAAREHLVTANSRLVISVAKRYTGRGVPFSDLIQEGNIGLIRATKKFEHQRGLKFSTYATWWIRQAITRAIADQGRTIRLPVHMGEQINRLLRANHQLTQELGRQPTDEELAERLQLPPNKVEQMKTVAQRPLSLEMPANEEGDSVLGDFLPDLDAEPPAEAADQTLMRRELRSALEELPPRERAVLELRFGLADGAAYTLEEVGNKLGVTRERARQIEAQAMTRLRDPRIRRKLIDFLRR